MRSTKGVWDAQCANSSTSLFGIFYISFKWPKKVSYLASCNQDLILFYLKNHFKTAENMIANVQTLQLHCLVSFISRSSGQKKYLIWWVATKIQFFFTSKNISKSLKTWLPIFAIGINHVVNHFSRAFSSVILGCKSDELIAHLSYLITQRWEALTAKMLCLMRSRVLFKQGRIHDHPSCARWAGAVFDVPRSLGQEQWGLHKKFKKKHHFTGTII